MQRSLPGNESVSRGNWGEDVAVRRLRGEGLVVVERNARPHPRDRRLEIDVVAYDRQANAMAFVEVKAHKSHKPWERRLRSVTGAKRRKLRRACNAWLLANRWRGSYRFDVVEVFGSPGSRPETDYVKGVNLFTHPSRFVRWGDC